MMMKQLSFILVISIFLFACKSKKVTVSAPAKSLNRTETNTANFINQVIEQKNHSEVMYLQADADYQDPSSPVKLGMEIQTVKDQYIWINVKALGLLSVARILIQPDSIRILDLVNREYVSASYDYLKRFSDAPIRFQQLQNLIWGNALFDPSSPQAKIDSAGNELHIVQGIGQVVQNTLYQRDLKAKNCIIHEAARKQDLQVVYDNFFQENQNRFPSSVEIHIQAEKKVDCTFAINNFAFVTKRQPTFVVPSSYKVRIY